MTNKLPWKALVVFEIHDYEEEEKTKGRAEEVYWFMRREEFGCPNKIVQELQLKDTNIFKE